MGAANSTNQKSEIKDNVFVDFFEKCKTNYSSFLNNQDMSSNHQPLQDNNQEEIAIKETIELWKKVSEI